MRDCLVIDILLCQFLIYLIVMSVVLNRRVLLLNQSYEPIMVVRAKKAIILILGGKVEALENYKEIIHSAYLNLPLPSVIKLKEYVKIKRREAVLSRKNILKRDNNECQYCGEHSVNMTIDHVIPKCNGGEDTWYNLVAACAKCNIYKGNRSLKDAKMSLRIKPRKPNLILHLQKMVKDLQSNWRPYLFMKEFR